MQKKWIVRDANPFDVKKISGEPGISELTARILYQRGIRDAQAMKNFLEPEAAPFYNPFDMKGMREAVDRIKQALDAHEKICVYGDYDVDGMSASAILIRTLRKFDAQVENYIPERSEGYGLNVPALQKISSNGADLLISVDCGITNEREIAAVADKLDVIVTDHHLPALDDVQSAVAVVNPNQRGCPYPEKNLCGAGVAFKLSQALMSELRDEDIQNYTTDIDIAALATVADLVPLVGENRKIVRMGLKAMRETTCVGLKALVNVAGLGYSKRIAAGHVAFQIAPRLNSIGRLKTASEGVKLLLTEDADEAKTMAKRLDKMNQRRKDIEAQMLAEAEEKVRVMREERGGDLSTLVIAGEGWLEGVIGLTASKLVERYNLPTIILTKPKIYRAKCLSIPAFNIKDALDSMEELFDKYNANSQTAEFIIEAKNLPKFNSQFNYLVRQRLNDEGFRQIDESNQLCGELDDRIWADAVEKVRQLHERYADDSRVPVIEGEGWQDETVDLVAAKLVERYKLPAIVLTRQETFTYRGSCRSIPALHMKNALDTMAELFDQYGGHSQAAGLSIKAENLPEFAARFDYYVRQKLRDEDFQPILNVDALIDPAQITFDAANEIYKFEPYGIGNPHPVLACRNVRGFGARAIGKDGAHLSFSVGENIRAIAWNCGNLAPLVEEELIDLAYEPEINEWQGEVRIQCNVSSLEPAAQGEAILSDDGLREVYTFLRRARSMTEKFSLCALVRAFNSQTGKNLSTYTFDGAIKVFEELGLLIIDRDKKTFELPRPKNKLELMNSRTYRLGRRERGLQAAAPPPSAKVISIEEASKRRSLQL